MERGNAVFGEEIRKAEMIRTSWEKQRIIEERAIITWLYKVKSMQEMMQETQLRSCFFNTMRRGNISFLYRNSCTWISYEIQKNFTVRLSSQRWNYCTGSNYVKTRILNIYAWIIGHCFCFYATRRGDFVKKDKFFQTFLFYIGILPFLNFLWDSKKSYRWREMNY